MPVALSKTITPRRRAGVLEDVFQPLADAFGGLASRTPGSKPASEYGQLAARQCLRSRLPEQSKSAWSKSANMLPGPHTRPSGSPAVLGEDISALRRFT